MNPNTFDLSEETTLVRFNIGDFEEPYIFADSIISFRLSQYPSATSAGKIWLASLDLLRYMKALYAKNGGRKREREGGLEIEEYGREKYKSICEMYDDLLRNPPTEATGLTGMLHYFGGIDKATSQAIEEDCNLLGPGVKLGWFDDENYTIPSKRNGDRELV